MCLLSGSAAILYRMIRNDHFSASASSRLRIAHAVVLTMAAGSLVAGATVFVDARPGPDLKPDEVTLRIGGRPRPVDSLNMIEVAAGGGRTPVSPLPAPFGS